MCFAHACGVSRRASQFARLCKRLWGRSFDKASDPLQSFAMIFLKIVSPNYLIPYPIFLSSISMHPFSQSTGTLACGCSATVQHRNRGRASAQGAFTHPKNFNQHGQYILAICMISTDCNFCYNHLVGIFDYFFVVSACSAQHGGARDDALRGAALLDPFGGHAWISHADPSRCQP